MIQVLKHSTPIARKDHTCNFCGLTIQTGEAYEYQFCVNDCGDSYTFKSHRLCQGIVHDFCSNDDGGGYDHNDLEVTVSEHFENVVGKSSTGLKWSEKLDQFKKAYFKL